MQYSRLREKLLATTFIAGLAISAQPAFAQAATQPATPAPAAQDSTDKPADNGEIIVTGSLFRRTAKDIPPTVVSVTAAQLNDRGITTVAQALQTLSSNGAGTLPGSFSANGAFAAGATAPALRGLTTNSTLVLFDGLRSAYYPLADDGQRNFVDTNTIPEAIIDRIETLQDGASSTYGADAVAGVVNIIVKKEIKGFHGNVEAGVSKYGDAGERRASATYGYGDLDEQGFNVYANFEYQKDDMVLNRDRGYPYNTANLSRICEPGTGSCLTNGIQNGVQYNGVYTGLGTTTVAVVRPYNAANTAAVPGSRYQLLNPAAGCGSLTPVTLTAAQAASTGGATAAINNCQQDLVRDYGVISPSQQRIGGTLHFTKNIGDSAQAYAMFNYYQNDVFYTTTQQALRAVTPPAATGVTYSTATLALPVYICARGTTAACTAANGTLNPNNPFAANNQVARIYYRFGDIPRSNRVLSRTYHGSAGINGSFGDDWNYDAQFTGSSVVSKQTTKGVLYVQHLLDVIADGSYNFVNPSQNTQAVRDYVAPTNVNQSTSNLYQGQANLTHGFFDLPGGKLQVAVGGAVRYESIDAPSANPDDNGPTQRYFTINPFGTSGHRWVQSGFFEINAPVLKQVEINGSGRYDHYSSGQSNFSPKVGVKITPVRQVAFHGTWSRGFRIPSFAEAYALPTTGYINDTPPANFAALHPGSTYADTYSLGLTSVGNRNLKPEKSENFTAGVTVQPKPWFSFTADYFHIKKTGVIASANYALATAAYYADQPIPTGFTVIPDVADPTNPNAKPRIGFVQSSYINANSLVTSGIDLSFNANVSITDDLKWNSTGTATWVQKLNQTFPDGTVQHYAGTLGPYAITSASGTPQWRANMTNTLTYKSFSLSGTVYYTSGYETTAEDNGDVKGDCSSNQSRLYRNGDLSQCHVKRFIDVDMTASMKVNDKFTIYTNIYNLFDVKPSLDLATYGAYLYNPAWSSQGIIGRYFKVGARVDF